MDSLVEHGIVTSYRCRHCGDMFHPKGIKKHEQKCMPVYTPRPQRHSPIPDESIPPSARFEFPRMLYNMLEDCTFDEDYCKIVSWQPHGLAFKVHNRLELEKILHRWFREKYESFRCLLEQWGFVKLSRGKDRGCWYQKNFYHLLSFSSAKKRYEDVGKADFIRGMPEYLSPRDEPDLEKESTLDNRISTKKRKTKGLLSLLDDGTTRSEKLAKTSSLNKGMIGATKDKARSPNTGKRRYDESTHKECRYCHGLFAAQGFSRHEESCRMATFREESVDNIADIADNDDAPPDMVKCRYCGVYFSKYGIKKHELFCPHANDSNLSESEESDSSNKGTVKCRYCNASFSKYGIGRHELFCKGKGRDKTASGRSHSGDSMELESEDGNEFDRQHLIPCKYCGELFSKYGVKKHELFCKEAESPPRTLSKLSNNDNDDNKRIAKGNENRSNYKRSALSDDSSVSSNESGCRICGFDDDHANLLLCEGCDTELHTYCLNPPLDKVPEGDWFCDVCKARIEEAEIDLAKLIRRVPPGMEERFGEICFAKSAENAHWWPALIFDPRSFLHNPQVVELARRNLGKRYLVFFFENQDAFAAIPKTWIVTWEEGVRKEFDRGKSVRHASKGRKEQFERAMDLANEAFAAVAAGGYSDTETEFGSQDESESDHYSGTSDIDSIPKEIGVKSSTFELDPEFDWRAVRDEAIREAKAASPSEYPKEISHEISKSMLERPGGKIMVQRYFGKRMLYVGTFLDQYEAALASELFVKKMREALAAVQNDDDTLDPRSISGEATNKNESGTNLAPSERATKTPANESKKPDSPSFGTFTDKRPYRSRFRSVANRMTPKALPNTEIVHSLQSPKRVDPTEKKTELQTQIPPCLTDRERDELLLGTSFCHYYLLPLSEL